MTLKDELRKLEEKIQKLETELREKMAFLEARPFYCFCSHSHYPSYPPLNPYIFGTPVIPTPTPTAQTGSHYYCK
jgi:hypothetical protein